MSLHIRALEARDPVVISAAFGEMGWNKPVEQYERYLAEQLEGKCEVLVAELLEVFAGYLTIVWETAYEPFARDGIPEVQDFNVVEKFRRRGVGTALMDRAEEVIATRSDTAGIGVGMYPDYGNAQRLYVLRGYVPDGRGVTYERKVLPPMAQVINDDSLALYFTKSLR